MGSQVDFRKGNLVKNIRDFNKIPKGAIGVVLGDSDEAGGCWVIFTDNSMHYHLYVSVLDLCSITGLDVLFEVMDRK